jgi:hypothetical protein
VSAESRLPVWVYALAAGLAMLAAFGALAMRVAFEEGTQGFYRSSDPIYFRAVAEAPFGDGHAFAAPYGHSEAAYRYGRIGLPLLAWVTSAGRLGVVPTSLVVVNIVALAAVVALAVLYLGAVGRDPRFGLLVLLAPGLLLLYNRPYGDPLCVALVLAALVLDRKDHRGWAAACLAYAILTRETAVLALIAFVWRDVARRDRRVWQYLLAVVPYVAWMLWVRIRVGELPFLADTPTRRMALRAPFVGLLDSLTSSTAPARGAVLIALATLVVALVFGWLARAVLAGGVALAGTVLVVCLGPATLQYLGETLRVLLLPQVVSLLCVGYVVSASTTVASQEQEVG